jgi:hypothetical protein
LDLIFEFKKSKDDTCVNRIDIAIYLLICSINISIVVLFGISFKIFINTIYYQAENLREPYCRCDNYGFQKFDEGKFGHKTVYILNNTSLFLSSVSFALLFAREN